MSAILSLHDLPKELVDLIVKAIRDLKSWLLMRLTCKRCWTLCSLEQYRVQFLVQVKLEEKTYGMLPNKLKYGEHKEWYEGGQPYQLCFYKDDQLEGESKRWYEDGQLRVLCLYKAGQLEGEARAWHKNGQLCALYFYKGDKLEGEYKTWYEDGQLSGLYFYKDGQLQGKYKKWHRNGQLMEGDRW
jgi:antitoxin component YwqK of YwqJK toxin-antitoxin module